MSVQPERSVLRLLIRKILRLDGESERLHEALRRLVMDLRPKSLLDVGCGDGKWAEETARQLEIPAGELRGIEICPPLLEEARKRLKLMTIDLENQQWPLSDRSVDLVTINQVLEHLKNAHFCLAEGERVLRVGGHLAIGIPNLSGLMNRLFLLIGRQPMCILFPGPHVRSFTHETFLRFLRMNPAFTVVRCRGSSLYPFPPPILERGAEKFPAGSAYSFYLLKKVAHRDRSVWMESLNSIGATSYKHC